MILHLNWFRNTTIFVFLQRKNLIWHLRFSLTHAIMNVIEKQREDIEKSQTKDPFSSRNALLCDYRSIFIESIGNKRCSKVQIVYLQALPNTFAYIALITEVEIPYNSPRSIQKHYFNALRDHMGILQPEIRCRKLMYRFCAHLLTLGK